MKRTCPVDRKLLTWFDLCTLKLLYINWLIPQQFNGFLNSAINFQRSLSWSETHLIREWEGILKARELWEPARHTWSLSTKFKMKNTAGTPLLLNVSQPRDVYKVDTLLVTPTIYTYSGDGSDGCRCPRLFEIASYQWDINRQGTCI